MSFVIISKKQEDAPQYGPAKNPDTTCGNCLHGSDGYCDLYKFNYKSGYWCSSWEPMEKRMEKHIPPSEVMHNAQRGLKLYQHLPLEHQTMDAGKAELMRGLSVGRPLSKEELDSIHSHHQQFPQHPDKHVHLGMGGRAGRSWVKRIKRMYYPIDTAAGAEAASKNLDVELHGTISKVDADLKRVWGWASVIQRPVGKPLIDHQGDVITPDELQAMAWTYLDESRTAGVMHQKTKGIGYLIDSIVFTKDIQDALNIDLGQVGWFIGFQIQDDATWDRIRRGELNSFSIHGTGKRSSISEKDLGKLV